MRKTNWLIGVAVLAAAFALAGCADQSGMEQLNKNEFTLRGMIASDRQQIDALKAQVARQNDQIEELQHNTTPVAGQASGVNDRVASLEAEVKARGMTVFARVDHAAVCGPAECKRHRQCVRAVSEHGHAGYRRIVACRCLRADPCASIAGGLRCGNRRSGRSPGKAG